MNMLKKEWLRIWKDRKMLLAICGILVVPLLALQYYFPGSQLGSV